MSRIELTEFEESQPLNLSNEEYIYLKEYHSTHLDIRKLNSTFCLRPKSYVGFIQLLNKTLYIKPKIPDENLLFILSYLYDQIDIGEDVEFSQKETASILDIMAFILTSWTNKLIKRGLYRYYIRKQDRIPRLRGKIIHKKNLFYFDKIYCSFDELSHSVYENIILKATLRLILSIQVMDVIKNSARVLLKLLSDIEDVCLSEKLFNRIYYSRLNKYYYKVIQLCYLIWKNYSIHQVSRDLRFPGFLVNMNNVFEEFIRKFLVKSLPEETIAKRHKGKWADGTNLALLPEMQPDIVIDDKLVIDMKYYRSVLGPQGKYHSSHIYQILSYMKVLNIDGILIYPEVAEKIQETYTIEGNSFSIKTIDVRGTREEFKAELLRFVDYVKERFSYIEHR